MGNALRDRRSPQEFAAGRQVIEFKEKISSFERLAQVVEAELGALDTAKRPENWHDAPVTGRLSFGFADAQSGLPALSGTVDATVDAVCQRCLEPMELPLHVDLQLLLGAGETTVTDAGDYDVWELGEAQMRPLDVVEESLLMALPFAAKHPPGAACVDIDNPPEAEDEKLRPFAALKAQMENDN